MDLYGLDLCGLDICGLNRRRSEHEDGSNQAKTHGADPPLSSRSLKKQAICLQQEPSPHVASDESTDLSSHGEATPTESQSEIQSEDGDNNGSISWRSTVLPPIPQDLVTVRRTFIHIHIPQNGACKVRRSRSAPASHSRHCESSSELLQEIVPSKSVASHSSTYSTCNGVHRNGELHASQQPVPSTGINTASLTDTTEVSSPAHCDEQKELPLYPVGTAVVINGLTVSTDFNGRSGIVQSWDAQSRRYKVQLCESTGLQTERHAMLRGENLSECPPLSPACEVAKPVSEEEQSCAPTCEYWPSTPRWEHDDQANDNIQPGMTPEQELNEGTQWSVSVLNVEQSHWHANDTFFEGACLHPGSCHGETGWWGPTWCPEAAYWQEPFCTNSANGGSYRPCAR